MGNSSGLTGGAIQVAAGASSGQFDADITLLGQATSNFDAQLITARTAAISEFDAKVCVEIEAIQISPSATIVTPTLVNSSGLPPFTTTFVGAGIASGNKRITNYTWYFNDVSTVVSGGQTVEYTFNNSGSLLVVLRVTDEDGFVGYDARRILTYSGIALDLPELQISGIPQVGSTPLTVDFGASGGITGGTIRSYGWSFGHGKFSKRQNQNDIVYNTPGAYLVVCTLSDNRGVRMADSLEIGVNN